MYKCCSILLLLLFSNTGAGAQSVTGKWRWQVPATMQDLQTDYTIELDLKQVGKKVYGTRTLYLQKYPDMIIGVEGEMTTAGELKLQSTRPIQYDMPDSILVAISFSYSLKLDKFNDRILNGIYTPREDTAKKMYRLSDPGFYNSIYLRPQQYRAFKVADTLTAKFDSLASIKIPKPVNVEVPVKVKPTVPQVVTEVEHTITIPAGDVLIELYDNGSIDGDIVTLIVNGKVMSAHQTLGLKPIQLSIKKEDLVDNTMVVIEAENLGEIPPNTALMLITTGGKRYDLNISSNLQKRAAVILKLVK